jgi:hypothetical protein
MLIVQQYGCISVKSDDRTIGPTYALSSSNHHSVIDLAFLDAAPWYGILYAYLDDVTDARVTTMRSAQHLDAHYLPGSTVVCHIQATLHLYHLMFPEYAESALLLWLLMGLFENTMQFPDLILRQRTTGGNFHQIAFRALIVFVVRH